MPNIEVKKKSINMNINAGKIYPRLENLEVNPTKEKQTFKSNSYGYDEVVVNPVNLQDKTVRAIDIEQVITADEGYVGLNEITVGKIAPTPYRPRTIKFANYTGTELDYELENLDTSNVQSGEAMFNYCQKLEKLDLSKLETGNMTSMKQMFANCSTLKELDLSNFDTSNVTKMDSMFNTASKLETINISGFKTSKVYDMSGMFSYCSQLKNIIGIKNLDVSSLGNVVNLFYSSVNITEIDLSGWNNNIINNCYNMFNNCQALTTLKLGNINITSATNMSGMFYCCYALTELDLSKWETTKATNMGTMFASCRALTKLDIRNFTFDKVTSYNNMFKDVPVDCLIIVKDDTAKEWITSKFSTLTNVKTVAELEG